MGLALAFKRVGRVYQAPLRRLFQGAGFCAVGFIAGMGSGLHFPNVAFAAMTEWLLGITIALLLVLGAIKLVMDAPLPDRK
jgi:hypothetical protein